MSLDFYVLLILACDFNDNGTLEICAQKIKNINNQNLLMGTLVPTKEISNNKHRPESLDDHTK